MAHVNSDSKLRSIKAPYTGKFEIADRDGLTIRISKNAVITFNFRFNWQGKGQRMKIGHYPEVRLSEAREQVTAQPYQPQPPSATTTAAIPNSFNAK